ncbi:MAG TPA: SDR family NAD(P)-dependent oxidoreductase [Candidatus Acidoferrales bacterium]|nr:SDR family NAD(P)-dependent oxidoreductase [Candidatus Acidoferrales bacterium]
MKLAGKVAVVTGAGSGIGRATAIELAAAGANVVVAGRRRARLDETVQCINKVGGCALALECDVSSGIQVQNLIRSTLHDCGRLDILVNNAAQNRPDPPPPETVADLPDDWWDTTQAVNLRGVFLCCKHALPALIGAGGGSIVNIASTSGVAGNSNQAAYIASKHGVVGLTKSIALDYASHNVRANAVCPGFIETERSLHFSEKVRGSGWRESKLARIPLGRLGKPEDVARLVLFLASEDAAFITGTVIPIDGGTAARR